MSNSCNIYVRIFQLSDKQIAKGYRLDIVFHLLLLLSSSTSFSYINLFFFESTLSILTNCVGIFLRETSSKFINLVLKFKISHLSKLCDLIDWNSRIYCSTFTYWFEAYYCVINPWVICVYCTDGLHHRM